MGNNIHPGPTPHVVSRFEETKLLGEIYNTDTWKQRFPGVRCSRRDQTNLYADDTLVLPAYHFGLMPQSTNDTSDLSMVKLSKRFCFDWRLEGCVAATCSSLACGRTWAGGRTVTRPPFGEANAKSNLISRRRLWFCSGEVCSCSPPVSFPVAHFKVDLLHLVPPKRAHEVSPRIASA